MSSEQNAPEVQEHQGPPLAAQMDGQMGQNDSPQDAGHNIQHGLGQSKTSSRRRRQRKNKSLDGAQQGVQGGGGQVAGDMQVNGQGNPSPGRSEEHTSELQSLR